MIWTHPLNFQVKMDFDGEAWVCHCEDLGVEATIPNQEMGALEKVLEDLIDDRLCLKKASGIKPKSSSKSIWDLMLVEIESGLILWPNAHKKLFQKGASSIFLVHNRTGYLSLMLKNGKVNLSPPLVRNPTRGAVDDWRLLDKAREIYDTWVERIT
jgi:hypothetical protein